MLTWLSLSRPHLPPRCYPCAACHPRSGHVRLCTAVPPSGSSTAIATATRTATPGAASRAAVACGHTTVATSTATSRLARGRPRPSTCTRRRTAAGNTAGTRPPWVRQRAPGRRTHRSSATSAGARRDASTTGERHARERRRASLQCGCDIRVAAGRGPTTPTLGCDAAVPRRAAARAVGPRRHATAAAAALGCDAQLGQRRTSTLQPRTSPRPRAACSRPAAVSGPNTGTPAAARAGTEAGAAATTAVCTRVGGWATACPSGGISAARRPGPRRSHATATRHRVTRRLGRATCIPSASAAAAAATTGVWPVAWQVWVSAACRVHMRLQRRRVGVWGVAERTQVATGSCTRPTRAIHGATCATATAAASVRAIGHLNDVAPLQPLAEGLVLTL